MKPITITVEGGSNWQRYTLKREINNLVERLKLDLQNPLPLPLSKPLSKDFQADIIQEIIDLEIPIVVR